MPITSNLSNIKRIARLPFYVAHRVAPIANKWIIITPTVTCESLHLPVPLGVVPPRPMQALPNLDFALR